MLSEILMSLPIQTKYYFYILKFKATSLNLYFIRQKSLSHTQKYYFKIFIFQVLVTPEIKSKFSYNVYTPFTRIRLHFYIRAKKLNFSHFTILIYSNAI